MKRASAPLSQYRYLVDLLMNSWGAAETYGFQTLAAAQKFIKRRGVQWSIREWNGTTFTLHSESK